MSYCYSFNEEDYYPCDSTTREAAIAEARELAEDDEHPTVWIGKMVPFRPIVWASRVVDDVVNQAYDDVPDYADGWLDLVLPAHETILTNRLSAVFDEWMKEFGYVPSFYTVDEIEEVTVTPTPA